MRKKSIGSQELSEAEIKANVRQFSALQRIAKIAVQAGASDDDVTDARMWPLLWIMEVMKRKQLEPLAEIGRKVRDSRAADTSKQLQRDAEIGACACRLLLKGAKPRGLASKIRRELNCKESERHINRILDRMMPMVLSDFK